MRDLPRVVVLGGSGFIGRAIVSQARRQGLEGVSIGSSTIDLSSGTGVHVLTEYLDGQTILVLAARARQRADPWTSLQDDLMMTVNVARILSRHRLRKSVYISSLAVYGDAVSNTGITEDTPLAPTSPYGAGKMAAESVLQQAASQSSTPYLVLRPAMVYGPGDTSNAYGPAPMLAAALGDGRIRVHGDGAELRPYLFIADAASLIIRLAVSACEGVFNLASEVSHSFEDIVAILRTATGRSLEVAHVPRRRRHADLGADPAKLRGVVPDFTFTGLQEGLTETCRAMASVSESC